MNIEKAEYKDQKYLMESAPGALTIINGGEYNYFGGTSYYELHNHPEVINSSIEALKKYGVNSSSSRTNFGTTPLLLEVEKKAAEYFNCEDAVYLPSGFLSDIAAVLVLKSLEMFDVIFIDETAHYSNNYASSLSGLPIYEFSHMSEENLEEQIKANLQPGEKPLIITDGIFPIFGRIAPVDRYLRIIEKYNGILWVDDAHGMGILGSNGRGSYDHFDLSSDKIYFGGTLSKALGGFGGIIPGRKDFITEIRTSNILSGTTPPTSAAAAASLTGLKILSANKDMRIRLWKNAVRLKAGLSKIGINVERTSVPIAAWTQGNMLEMKSLQQELMRKKIAIQFIQYVGAGESGALRIVVFSTHTTEQIDNLLYELSKTI